jgi:branched-chain amino acid transport system substrate-binding protein
MATWLPGKAEAPLIYTYLPDPLTLPSSQPLLAEAKSRGVDLNNTSIQAYAGLEAWARAVRRAGSLEAAKVAAVLHKESFQTVIGTISFDAKGDLEGAAGQWMWYRWHDGKVEHYEGRD